MEVYLQSSADKLDRVNKDVEVETLLMNLCQVFLIFQEIMVMRILVIRKPEEFDSSKSTSCPPSSVGRALAF